MRNLKEAFSQVGLELKQESVKCRVCSAEKVKKKWSLDGFFHGTNVLVPWQECGNRVRDTDLCHNRQARIYNAWLWYIKYEVWILYYIYPEPQWQTENKKIVIIITLGWINWANSFRCQWSKCTLYAFHYKSYVVKRTGLPLFAQVQCIIPK